MYRAVYSQQVDVVGFGSIVSIVQEFLNHIYTPWNSVVGSMEVFGVTLNRAINEAA